ncbi:hypothetical protein [Lysobacter sp. Root667]|uniref:hypothetical protein n=1 Tax=Lysobacter sp. Root667 TaxID=1736581 RepID=UPI001F2F7FDB|nr:hypothetical protein [Lysobacter sp. Root667]
MGERDRACISCIAAAVEQGFDEAESGRCAPAKSRPPPLQHPGRSAKYDIADPDAARASGPNSKNNGLPT